jgi:hypothetical protein
MSVLRDGYELNSFMSTFLTNLASYNPIILHFTPILCARPEFPAGSKPANLRCYSHALVRSSISYRSGKNELYTTEHARTLCQVQDGTQFPVLFGSQMKLPSVCQQLAANNFFLRNTSISLSKKAELHFTVADFIYICKK